MKVKPFDKYLLRQSCGVLSIIGVIATILLLFEDGQCGFKMIVGVSSISVFFACYFFLLVYANLKTKATLRINSSTIEIKTGDIFAEDGLKVINFNEYFDTVVDDVLISNKTLNGMFINEYITDIDKFDEHISKNHQLLQNIHDENMNRAVGKKTRYKLGSVCLYNDFILTAFSRFDADNRAYLFIRDYIRFLLKFWDELDIVYSGRNIVIPVFGSGLTRFKGNEHITDQELLEIILWSFKVSSFTIKSQAKLIIVIGEKNLPNVNLYRLKHFIN